MRRDTGIGMGAFLLILLFLAGFVSAQSRIESIDISRFPSVELHIILSTPLSGTERPSISNVRLDENGVPQIVDYFECPQDSVRLSVAILLDRSSSMARIDNDPDRDSTKLREAKKAIATFLGLLGPLDEAALFSFTTHSFTLRHIFTVEHDFTFDKDSIAVSLVPIAAGGGTRLWQAIIDAVARLKDREGRRALIVLTDGRNQLGESYHSPAIQAAVDAGIPVYAIGLGDDADIGALSGLAAATGGRFHHAPQPAELGNIFNTIAGVLMTDACVLRYTSSNPCRDGSRREIDLELSGPVIQNAMDSFYVVPLDLAPVTLSMQRGIVGRGRDTIRVPFFVEEQFSTSALLSYSMTIGYASMYLEFAGVSTAATMSEGRQVDVSETLPGELRISTGEFYPFLPTGTLFELLFVVRPVKGDMDNYFFLSKDAQVRGACPTQLRTDLTHVTTLACNDRFVIGDSTRFVIPGDGSEHRIPLRLVSALPPGAPVEVILRIDHATQPYEVVGVEGAGTLAGRGGVLMQEVAPGIKELRVQSTGGAGDTVLCFLRLRAREVSRGSLVCALPMGAVDIRSDCRTTVEGDRGENWGTLLIDGVCEPVLRLRNSARIANHPNPFSPGTSVCFTVPTDGHVLLHVTDAHGRIVRTLLDATLVAGEYVHHFEAGQLPAGEYYALLSTDSSRTVHRMILVK